MLLTHMQRFTYSATGALRWKRDVTEYAEVLRNSHSPTTNAQVSTLLLSMPVTCSFPAMLTFCVLLALGAHPIDDRGAKPETIASQIRQTMTMAQDCE